MRQRYAPRPQARVWRSWQKATRVVFSLRTKLVLLPRILQVRAWSSTLRAMEKVVSAEQAGTDFLEILKQVARGDHIVVTHRGRRRAVVLDYDHLKTIQEVARLARDPEAQAAIERSDDDVSAGRVYALTGRPTLRRLRTLSRKAVKPIG